MKPGFRRKKIDDMLARQTPEDQALLNELTPNGETWAEFIVDTKIARGRNGSRRGRFAGKKTPKPRNPYAGNKSFGIF